MSLIASRPKRAFEESEPSQASAITVPPGAKRVRCEQHSPARAGRCFAQAPGGFSHSSLHVLASLFPSMEEQVRGLHHGVPEL